MYNYKDVERMTYTFIAFPGFFLGFSALQNVVTALVSKCWKGEVHRSVRWLAGALAVSLECFLSLGFYVANAEYGWTCDHPQLAKGRLQEKKTGLSGNISHSRGGGSDPFPLVYVCLPSFLARS